MSELTHALFPKKVKAKRERNISIDILPMAEEFCSELEKQGIIERLKQVSQLGMIHVNKRSEKSRYDYIMLQLYYHQLIRINIQKRLEFTYSKRIKQNSFLTDNELEGINLTEFTIGEAIQILAFAYNMGHFFNTFVASRAVVVLSNTNPTFRNLFKNSIKNERCREAAEDLLKSQNYQRIHLLHSLLALEHCDETKTSVRIAKELILAYLNMDMLPKDSGLHYCFKLFRKVRTLAFITYDLNISGVPFSFNAEDDDAVVSFFDEYLAEYNSNELANGLVTALTKLLSDSVYDNPETTICMTQIAKTMARSFQFTEHWTDYYNECWLNPDSIMNRKYTRRIDFRKPTLKISFSETNQDYARSLYTVLDKAEHVRAGYYIRHNGVFTLLAAIQKGCNENKKIAFRILKAVTSYLQEMNTDICDPNYILAVKFFLYYLFNERSLSINPVLDEKKCVICTRGHQSRKIELRKMLNNGTADARHEVEAMIDFLDDDSKNDVAILVFGSTVVLDDSNQDIAEFDGIVVFPNRKQEQIVLLEAKNTRRKPFKGRRCLIEKLEKLGIQYSEEDVIVFGHDAYFKITI